MIEDIVEVIPIIIFGLIIYALGFYHGYTWSKENRR